MRRLLSAGDVRRILNVTYQRVHALRLTGKIKGYRVTAGWLYDPESVEAYRRQRDELLAKRGGR